MDLSKQSGRLQDNTHAYASRVHKWARDREEERETPYFSNTPPLGMISLTHSERGDGRHDDRADRRLAGQQSAPRRARQVCHRRRMGHQPRQVVMARASEGQH